MRERWKVPRIAEWKDPEIIYLQGVEEGYALDYVPIEEWSDELAVYGKIKVVSDCSREWKRGLTARLSHMH